MEPGSVFAGITFTGWTGTPGTGLALLAQYSAGGALWYLLAGLWLLRSARPSPAASTQTPPGLVGRGQRGGRQPVYFC